MEEKKESSSNDVPVLDIADYFSWRRKMKAYLKNFGIWEIVMNPPAPSNKKGKSTAQKKENKDNTTALKFLMDGLPNSVKEHVGEYTSAKDTWFNLESEYQNERPEPENAYQELEDKPPKDINQEEDFNKDIDSCDCNDNLCDEIEKFPANEDEGLSKAYVKVAKF